MFSSATRFKDTYIDEFEKMLTRGHIPKDRLIVVFTSPEPLDSKNHDLRATIGGRIANKPSNATVFVTGKESGDVKELKRKILD